MYDNAGAFPVDQAAEALEALRRGGVVAFPTDTVYGLGCDALNQSAVARLFRVKNRDRDMPLPVLIAELDALSIVAHSIPEAALLLARRYWPGRLTLVLPKSRLIPDILTAGLEDVGVRVPDHQVPVFLCRALGNPIVGTSANISGMPNSICSSDVKRQFSGGIDVIVDGGDATGGVESTVVGFREGVPVIIREGAISRTEIAQLCREAGLRI
jgi:L-threonylcarbamoyladenylate synthase